MQNVLTTGHIRWSNGSVRIMGWNLIIIGVLIALGGIALVLFPHMKLPLLPGDIFIQEKHATFYFPVVTSIIVSIILTIIINMLR